jgi:DNA-binding transcriptional regulator YiaG
METTDKNSNSQTIEEKSIAKREPKEIANIKTQLEYIKIHHLRVVGQLSLQEIADKLDISISKISQACRWVRENWEVLNTQEYLADAEKLIGAGIREYDLEIEKCREGELVTDNYMGNMVFPVLDFNGNQVRKVDKNHLRSLMKDRQSYVRMLLEVRGLFQKAQIILQKNPIYNEFNLRDVNETDKREIIEICGDNGQYPE